MRWPLQLQKQQKFAQSGQPNGNSLTGTHMKDKVKAR
jgi:hypothetical protein